MKTITKKILNELNVLPDEKQNEILKYIEFIKYKQSEITKKDELMIEGYRYLAEEHLMLCRDFGGNDGVN